MKIFGFDTHRRHDPWEDAPAWGREIGAQQMITILQNEAILAKLEERAPKLSPEDQATLDAIFDVAKSIVTKDDAALK